MCVCFYIAKINFGCMLHGCINGIIPGANSSSQTMTQHMYKLVFYLIKSVPEDKHPLWKIKEKKMVDRKFFFVHSLDISLVFIPLKGVKVETIIFLSSDLI